MNLGRNGASEEIRRVVGYANRYNVLLVAVRLKDIMTRMRESWSDLPQLSL